MILGGGIQESNISWASRKKLYALSIHFCGGAMVKKIHLPKQEMQKQSFKARAESCALPCNSVQNTLHELPAMKKS